MKNFVGLFFSFVILTVCNTSCFTQENYQHKSENEIAAMSPAERVDEYLKERYYHHPLDSLTPGQDQGILIKDYIRKDGIKVLPEIADVANRFHPENGDSFDTDNKKAIDFQRVLFLAEDIDNAVIRIRASEEGHATIKMFEDVLSRMKTAGYADEKYKWNRLYTAYSDKLRTMLGERRSFTDAYIRDTLRLEHNIQMSDEEVVKFSNYLTSLDPTHPSRCKLKLSICTNSKEYYEAYLKFKAEAILRRFGFDTLNIFELTVS